MPLSHKNDRLEELGLVAGDIIVATSKAWWYALAIGLVAVIPLFYLLRFVFVQTILSGYRQPAIIYTAAIRQPLVVLDQKVFTLGPNSYSGYARVKNTNLEWGVGNQSYTAEFKTLGGTVLTAVAGTTFILPASEKLIVFSRFTSTTKPDEINFTLGETKFTHKPQINVTTELERVSLNNDSQGALVSANLRNTSSYTIKQITLPVAVFNGKNEIIGVNSTYVSDVLSGETRSFQVTWPTALSGAVRTEVNAEVNIFDRNVLKTDKGVSPFDQQ